MKILILGYQGKKMNPLSEKEYITGLNSNRAGEVKFEKFS